MVTISSVVLYSKSQGISVDAVVCGLKRLIYQCQSPFSVERSPRPRCRVRRPCADRLHSGSVFDKRTGAEAISHGELPFLLLAAGVGGWEGRENLAGGK
jgi:hypothetical protein